MRFKFIVLVCLLLSQAPWAIGQELKGAFFKIGDRRVGLSGLTLVFQDFSVKISGRGEVRDAMSREDDAEFSKDTEFEPDDRTTTNGDIKIVYFNSFDEATAGKIESVNGVKFTYYTSFDIHDIPGRIKSIGNISFKYNNAFDIHDLKGTMKSVGDIDIKYNNAFDIHDKKGTVKSIGSVSISWFNAFDSESYRGKLKSIKGNTRKLRVYKG